MLKINSKKQRNKTETAKRKRPKKPNKKARAGNCTPNAPAQRF